MKDSLLANYYEDFHKVLDGLYESNHFLLDRDLESLSLLGKRKRVLEIGCGTGRVLSLSDVEEKYGVDISEFAVKKARSKGIKAQQIDIDSQDLPFRSNYFDGVLIIETLEHLFDPVHTLAEANRVLKNKGVLIVASPNIGYYLCRLSLLAGRFTDFHGTGLLVDEHIRFYTINSLTNLLNKTGFSVEKIAGCPKLAVNLKEKKNSKKRFQDFTNFRVIISSIDKILANKIPSLFAKGLVIKAIKTSKPKYRKNTPVNFLKTGKTYRDHFRVG